MISHNGYLEFEDSEREYVHGPSPIPHPSTYIHMDEEDYLSIKDSLIGTEALKSNDYNAEHYYYFQPHTTSFYNQQFLRFKDDRGEKKHYNIDVVSINHNEYKYWVLINVRYFYYKWRDKTEVLSSVCLGIVGNRELTMQTYINQFCDEQNVMMMNIFIVHEVGRIEDTCFINCSDLPLALDYLNTDRRF